MGAKKSVTTNQPVKTKGRADANGPRGPERSDMDTIIGLHSVLAALKNPRRTCVTLAYTGPFPLEDRYPLTRLKVDRPHLTIAPLEKDVFLKRVPEDSVHQRVLLLARPLPGVRLETVVEGLDEPKVKEGIDQPPQEKAVILLLDHITDPHNLGAILRSAAVFGVSAVVVTHRHSPHDGSAILAKTASGALEEVPLCPVTNLYQAMAFLKNQGFWIGGLDEEGTTNLRTFDLPNRLAIVLGAEGSGLRRLTKESCDFLVGLKTAPTFSTLNASNAAAVAMYEVFCRLLDEQSLTG